LQIEKGIYIYVVDGTVVNDPKSIFMFGSVWGPGWWVLSAPGCLLFDLGLSSSSFFGGTYKINHWYSAVSAINIWLKCATGTTAVTSRKVSLRNWLKTNLRILVTHFDMPTGIESIFSYTIKRV